jgi:secreted PhoX family phosphatase
MPARRRCSTLAILPTLIALGAMARGAEPARAQETALGPFQPLAASAACTPGGNPLAPLLLPAGYTQAVIASQPGFPDLPDMHTQNETGPQAGRFLYRTHETTSNGAVSQTDLLTLATSVVAQRADWERFDGIAWTPWGTILAAEEALTAGLPDPDVPGATAGLVYEIDPATGAAEARPAIGSRSHEGLRFDGDGNLYGISESSPPTGGYIYKFTPDTPGDLSSGQLFALRVTQAGADRLGAAVWLPLDRDAVKTSSDAAATAAGATGYARPEDVEYTTSSGDAKGKPHVLYVAVTGEARVLGIDLQGRKDQATVFDFVKAGVNAPADFEFPDNLALDEDGNLFITEDPGTAGTTLRGDDVWVAFPTAGRHLARGMFRFASLTDCNAEPTGIYFDLSGSSLYIHAQHRGGDGLDKALKIVRTTP